MRRCRRQSVVGLVVLGAALSAAPKPPPNVRVELHSEVVNVVADNFLCLTLDWWPSDKCDYGTCSWERSSVLTVDLESPRLIAAVRALAPLVLRVGGSLSDLVVYQGESDSAGSCKPFQLDNANSRIGFSDGCLSRARYAQVQAFCARAGAAMLFVLNALHGRTRQDGCCRECKRKWCNYTGRWDLGNSKALIGHTFARALSGEPSAPPVPYGFELGNELCGQKGLQAKLEPAPFAADYARLRQMIDALWRGAGGRGAPPHIAGPACELQPEWYRAFVKAFRPDALTHHAYLLGSGRMESLREKVLDPDYLNRALFLARNASDVASALRGRGMLWAGEAGGAYNSGQHYVTDTFLSNFWFLDELGTFAAAGHHVFCRQTLVGGNYGLLNSFHRPLPDFWAALLWRALMGAKVLRVKSGVPTVRAYAHCARRVDGSDETDGRVSLLLLNLAKTNPAVVDAFAAGRKILSEQSIYLVTSPSLDSIEVKLNGETLQTDGRGAMPTLRPRKRPGGTALVVPPLSYMFVVMAVEQFGSRGVCGDVVRDPIAPVAQLNDRLRAVAVQLAALVDSGAPASAPGAPGARAADAATATAADAVGGADALASGVEAAVAAAADDGDSGDSVEGFFADDDDSVAAALLGDGGGGADEGVAATPPPTGASAALGAPAGTPIRALIGRHAGTPIRRPARQSDASRLLVVGPVCGVVTLGLVLHSSRARSLLRSLLCSRKARVATRAHTT